jgi:hypothetical protein
MSFFEFLQKVICKKVRVRPIQQNSSKKIRKAKNEVNDFVSLLPSY